MSVTTCQNMWVCGDRTFKAVISQNEVNGGGLIQYDFNKKGDLDPCAQEKTYMSIKMTTHSRELKP